jgi:hypothetical protein
MFFNTKQQIIMEGAIYRLTQGTYTYILVPEV